MEDNNEQIKQKQNDLTTGTVGTMTKDLMFNGKGKKTTVFAMPEQGKQGEEQHGTTSGAQTQTESETNQHQPNTNGGKKL